MRPAALLFAIAVTVCASAIGAQAQEQPAPATDFPVAVDLPAGTYQLDPRHASVLFRIRHEGLAWFTARFDTKDASLVLDPADPSRSQLRASVDASTVNTGITNAQGERQFDQRIGRALGAETTPTITFASTSIERTGESTARVTGDLTLNGQTHPATLDVTFDGSTIDALRGVNRVLGFSATGVITRSDWGVTDWRAFTGDEVQIVIEAELVRS